MFTLRKNDNAYKDTRQQCSNYTVDFGEPISFFFFIRGGFCALAMGLQRYIKATKKDTIIYIYICVMDVAMPVRAVCKTSLS